MFIARNRFAVLDKGSNQILVKNLRNEITKKCAAPCASTDAIFYAGTGTLLCRSDDKVGSCLERRCRSSAVGNLVEATSGFSSRPPAQHLASQGFSVAHVCMSSIKWTLSGLSMLACCCAAQRVRWAAWCGLECRE